MSWRRAFLQGWQLLTRAANRIAWLRQLTQAGVQAGLLSREEAQRIEAQIPDPDIQLYLHCFAVHLCLLPATNIISVCGGAWYAWTHHLSLMQGLEVIAGTLLFFAIFPMSPGSLLRGLYVLWVVLRNRRLRRFKVALALSFWRYVGYVAFPLQMVTTFPALARFLATHWALEAARHFPVLGRRGGRLEALVFDLCFNLPLSIGRGWRTRKACQNATHRG